MQKPLLRPLLHLAYQAFMTAAYPVAVVYLLYQRCKHGKYRGHLREKLGLKVKISPKTNPHGIWIHAVSMGEMKAALAIYRELEKNKAPIYISSTTLTGLQEAKRLMPRAEAQFLLPIDHALAIKKLTQLLKPSILFIIESDFWWNLIEYTARSGAKVFVASGKLSEASFEVHKQVPWFFRELFAPCKLLCLQSQEDYQKFVQLGIDPAKLEVTGNLKIDTRLQVAAPQEVADFKKTWNIPSNKRVISIVSSHENEEKALLKSLQSRLESDSQLHILIAPRHPERFAKVQEEFSSSKEQVTVISALGQTRFIYAMSDICIVGGSFFPYLQGHNILEPVFFGVPVIFGSFMSSQKEFVKLACEYNCGLQQDLQGVAKALEEIFQSYGEFKARCLRLCQEVQGSSQRTIEAVNK